MTIKKLFDPFVYEAAILEFHEKDNTIIEIEKGQYNLLKSNLFSHL